MKCSECDCDIEVELPESDVGYGGGAACTNEACPKFEVDVWDEYVESLVDEDGNMPKRRMWR